MWESVRLLSLYSPARLADSTSLITVRSWELGTLILTLHCQILRTWSTLTSTLQIPYFSITKLSWKIPTLLLLIISLLDKKEDIEYWLNTYFLIFVLLLYLSSPPLSERHIIGLTKLSLLKETRYLIVRNQRDNGVILLTSSQNWLFNHRGKLSKLLSFEPDPENTFCVVWSVIIHQERSSRTSSSVRNTSSCILTWQQREEEGIYCYSTLPQTLKSQVLKFLWCQ